MYVALILGIIRYKLALVLGLVVQFIYCPLPPHCRTEHLSRTKFYGKGKRTRIKDDEECGSLNKGLRGILSAFVLRPTFAPMSSPLTDIQGSVSLGVSGEGIVEDSDGTDGESEEEQRWLLQQHIIECGCCFDSYPLDKIVQCPEAHLFCKSCMSSYASNLLGEHNHNIVCMDQSGCNLHIPQSQLERFLTPTLLDLYHRVKQLKEVEAAHLENLEECPFCDYKCIIEDEIEKSFRCENVDCGVVSCRECKNADHSPKSCSETEADKHLDVQHTVEEAMSHALMRNCPQCQKAFIKEHGCNKMTCPNCQTLSCYICREVIQGYEHFGSESDTSRCQVWDDNIETRHTDEVEAAAKKTLEELQHDGKIEMIDMCDGNVHPNKFRLIPPTIKNVKLRAHKTAAAA